MKCLTKIKQPIKFSTTGLKLSQLVKQFKMSSPALHNKQELTDLLNDDIVVFKRDKGISISFPGSLNFQPASDAYDLPKLINDSIESGTKPDEAIGKSREEPLKSPAKESGTLLSKIREFFGIGNSCRAPSLPYYSLFLGGAAAVSAVLVNGCGGGNPYLSDVSLSQLEGFADLNVPFVHQREGRGWCFPASTEMILRYYGRTDISQEQIASIIFKDPYKPETFSDWVERYKSFLNSIGFDYFSGFYTYNRIKWFLDNKYPVMISVKDWLQNDSDITHALVFFGYSEMSKLFSYHDPSWGPNCGIDYDYLVKKSTSDNPSKYIYGWLIKPKDRGGDNSLYKPDIPIGTSKDLPF